MLSDNPYLINSVDVIEPFSNSDHSMVNFQLVLNVHDCVEIVKPPVYDCTKADFDAIPCALVSHPFNFSTPSRSADEAWVDFVNPVYKIIQDFVPVKLFIHKGKATI